MLPRRSYNIAYKVKCYKVFVRNHHFKLQDDYCVKCFIFVGLEGYYGGRKKLRLKIKTCQTLSWKPKLNILPLTRWCYLFWLVKYSIPSGLSWSHWWYVMSSCQMFSKKLHYDVITILFIWLEIWYIWITCLAVKVSCGYNFFKIEVLCINEIFLWG